MDAGQRAMLQVRVSKGEKPGTGVRVVDRGSLATTGPGVPPKPAVSLTSTCRTSGGSYQEFVATQATLCY